MCVIYSQKTSTGAPFWSGPKRCPSAIEFDSNQVFGFMIQKAGEFIGMINYNSLPIEGECSVKIFLFFLSFFFLYIEISDSNLEISFNI